MNQLNPFFRDRFIIQSDIRTFFSDDHDSDMLLPINIASLCIFEMKYE